MAKEKFVIVDGPDSIKEGELNLYNISFDLFHEGVSIAFTSGTTSGERSRLLPGAAYSFTLKSLEDATFLADLKMILQELGKKALL